MPLGEMGNEACAVGNALGFVLEICAVVEGKCRYRRTCARCELQRERAVPKAHRARRAGSLALDSVLLGASPKTNGIGADVLVDGLALLLWPARARSERARVFPQFYFAHASFRPPSPLTAFAFQLLFSPSMYV